MKNVVLCFRSPDQNNYVGGVMTLLNGYLEHLQEFEKQGILLKKFDYHAKGITEFLPQKVSNVLYIPLQRMNLSKYLKTESVDCVSIHTSREFLFLKDVYLAKYIAKKHNRQVTLTIHVGDINTVFNRIEQYKRACISIIDKYVDRVIFLSKAIRDQFIEAGVRAEKCEILYNYFDFDGYEFKVKEQNKTLNALYVGAIHREKGIIELLHAIEELIIDGYDLNLNICGQITDKSIEAEFSRIVTQYNEHIKLLGYVKKTTKAETFDNADVLILPSYHEGMPLVILEALGAGCGIIATRVGATPEILNTNNAIWIETKNENSIYQALKTISQDRDTLAKMQESNKALSICYTVESHIEKYCSLLNNLTD